MDAELLIWINQAWANPWLDLLFIWISEKYTFSFPLLAILIVYFGLKYGKSGWILGLFIVLVPAIADLVGNMLKDFFSHPRPCFEYAHLLRKPGGISTACATSTGGMPSNHAINFFAVFTFLSVVLKRWPLTIAFITLSVLVGISRIYLANHFPSQVLVGAIIGAMIGYLLAWLCLKRWPFITLKNTSNI